MKKLVIISIFLFSVATLFGSETDVPKVNELRPETSIMITKYQTLPWANLDVINMQKVYSKDSYTLWKCTAYLITNFPGEHILGNKYNYFVFKNGSFHMTVTEMNKQSVYDFFTKDIS
ncbi:MAG: hypothetical protein C0596_17270 [Marinilabiliales bacterium]|nr:MAG: hypothetical protein C0596_17270 [Marinilabiliales bacterium]